MEQLKDRAKALGIKGYHLMKEDKLRAKIAEYEVKDEPEEKVKERDGWLYHKEDTPRMFAKGQVIPEGWSEENRKFWTFTDHGVWINVNNG